MAQQEIKLNEKQKAIMAKASGELNQAKQNLTFANEIANRAVNKCNDLIKVICLNKGIDAPEGTRFDGEKIIIPETKPAKSK